MADSLETMSDMQSNLAASIANEHVEREMTPWEQKRRDSVDQHERACIAALDECMVHQHQHLNAAMRWSDFVRRLREVHHLALVPVVDWRQVRDAVDTRIYTQALQENEGYAKSNEELAQKLVATLRDLAAAREENVTLRRDLADARLYIGHAV